MLSRNMVGPYMRPAPEPSENLIAILDAVWVVD